MTRRRAQRASAVFLLPFLLAMPVSAGGGSSPSGTQYSLWAGRSHPSVVYWGDTHVHSNLSADGNMAGNLDLGPEQAYRFARGEEVVSQSGQRAKLGRPLDFVVLADHAERLVCCPCFERETSVCSPCPSGSESTRAS